MVKVPVFDANGKELRKADFDESVFGEKVLTRTLRDVVIAYGRNKRQGTHAAKDRGDVAGSNKKLWKQKGTGRARVGDRRPPHWRGGGLAMGPHPVDYHVEIPSRMRHVALRSALLSKFKDGEVKVFEGLSFKDGPKTKKVAAFLDGAKVNGSTLIAIAGHDASFNKSVRNLERVKLRELRELNAYDIMRHVNLVLSNDVFETLKKGVSTDRRIGGPSGIENPVAEGGAAPAAEAKAAKPAKAKKATKAAKPAKPAKEKAAGKGAKAKDGKSAKKAKE